MPAEPGAVGGVATVAFTVTYLLPVVAIILGVTVLGESVSGLALGGIALILAGVALTRKGGSQPEPVLPE